MKIAFVTSFFPPDRIAGAELGTRFMAEHFARQGHEVHVLITRPSTPRPKEQQLGFSLHWLPFHQRRGLNLVVEVRSALRRLREIDPDVVHGNCLLPGGLIAALWKRQNPSTRSSVLCYGYDVCDMKGLVAMVGRWALRRLDQVLVATEYCRGVVKEHVPEVQSEVFLAGCDERCFPHLPLLKVKEPLRLLFIGRPIPEKGLPFLMEVLSACPLHVTLTIIGTPPDDSSLKELCEKKGVQDRVEVLGRVPNGELSDHFARHHVFILPSYREPLGVVCIEAILSGVPVVCSDVMGLPEAVAHGENGCVVEGRKVEDWVGAILRCGTDASFREQVHENGRRMHERWSWSTRLKELEGLILARVVE